MTWDDFGWLWSHFELTLGSLWGHCGITLYTSEAVWKYFGYMRVTLKSLCSVLWNYAFSQQILMILHIAPQILMILYNYEINLGALWDHSGVTLGIWGWLWITFVSPWHHFGITLASWHHFGSLRHHFGSLCVTLGLLWAHFDATCDVRGCFWATLGWLCVALEALLGDFGVTLADFRVTLKSLWARLK